MPVRQDSISSMIYCETCKEELKKEESDGDYAVFSCPKCGKRVYLPKNIHILKADSNLG